MGFYDFSKKHYLISAAIGDRTSELTKISKKYPNKTFMRNYFKHMRKSIHGFADQLYSSNDEYAGKLISMDDEISRSFVNLTALYFTVSMTARKENEKFLRQMNLSKTKLLEELYRQLEFNSEERKIGKHLVKQSELNFSTFTVNWGGIFAKKILRLDESSLSGESMDKLLQMIHGSFLFYMKSFS